ncbi:unnamed protein product [Clavelina lepadiformis]|uniref:Uncharacterized protein n=1 Tax=Clavelina lepadiformis TaxID=159417 RepID=A0ABP0F5E8_CLALP
MIKFGQKLLLKKWKVCSHPMIHVLQEALDRAVADLYKALSPMRETTKGLKMGEEFRG